MAVFFFKYQDGDGYNLSCRKPIREHVELSENERYRKQYYWE